MAKISGILNDPAGQPITNCTIELRSKRNTTNVLYAVTSGANTSSAGAYSMDVYSGVYDVMLRFEKRASQFIGSITVLDNSTDGSLNDFFMLSGSVEFDNSLLKEFNVIRDEITQNLIGNQTIAAEMKKIQQDVSQQADDIEQSTLLINDIVKDAKTISDAVVLTLEDVKNEIEQANEAVDKAIQAAMSIGVPKLYQVGSIIMAAPNSFRFMKPGETIEGASMCTVDLSVKMNVTKYSIAESQLDGIWRADGKAYFVNENEFAPTLFIRIS